MDDMINRHDSIAEENIEPNGRPAKDQFEEWSGEVADRAECRREQTHHHAGIVCGEYR